MRHLLSLDPDNVTLYYKEHGKSIKDQSTMKNAEGFKFMRSKQPGGEPRGNAKPEQPWGNLAAGTTQSTRGGSGQQMRFSQDKGSERKKSF